MQASNRLQHMPVSFFGMVMGLAGLTLANDTMESWVKGVVLKAAA